MSMYTFPAPGVLLPPMVNDTPRNPNPTDQGYDDYLLQRNFQGLADDHNKLVAAVYVRPMSDPNGPGTFENWYYWEYMTRQDPPNPPPVPLAQWVGTCWVDGIFISFTFVTLPFPVCVLTEDSTGWTLSNKRYAKIPPPQH